MFFYPDPMLAPLDNEVIFKIAFTDMDVFTCFVRDIVGINVQVNKIETEKRFFPKVGNIDFAYDIFAESTDHRIVIEIQKVEYDYHFDRFLHYHNMAIAELQRSAREYKIDVEVYTIVVLTSPYNGLDKRGRAIKNEVLISGADPRDLKDKIVPIYGHQLIFLNPHHKTKQTPQNYRDWLYLFYESTENRENYKVNLANKGIQKAVKLISIDNLSPEKNREIKETEGKRVVLSILQKEINQKDAWLKEAIDKRKEAEQDKANFQSNMIKKLHEKRNSMEDIVEITGVSLEDIRKILE
ncbi:MAG: PD-(D/E)XK nuclease family transposase [Leptospiraceae bacterium]|nr:PD-(D/E)XK nuclease family transposase [Leptospiraceae bacterium]